MDKKAQIQELIALGKTEEALELLEQLTSDAVLLQSRYNGAKRQYSFGMIDFSEWSRAQAQINYAALEMMNAVKNSVPAFKESFGIYDKPEVYLAYNSKDVSIAKLIKQYLEPKGIAFVDHTKLHAGQSLSDFVINKALKSEFILVLVSENSLRGGWTDLESHLDVFSNSLIQRNVIPIALDNSFANPKFIKDEMLKLEEQLDSMDLLYPEKYASNVDIEYLRHQKAALTVRYNNLPKIVQRLRNALVVDIQGDHFKLGMDKVINIIQINAQRIASAVN